MGLRDEGQADHPYFSLPEDDFDDPEALRAWFEGAREAAIRNAKPKRSRAKKQT